jgi:hypothetical protein
MSDEVTIERLERAVAVCAYIAVRDGQKAVPIFERLERELTALRSNEDAMVRAKELLVNLATSDLSMQHTPALTSRRMQQLAQTL